MSKKIIVTGGAGFIGSHLTHALLHLGFDVHTIDLAQGKENAYLRAGAQHHQVSITDFGTLTKIFRGAEYVFHLAAPRRTSEMSGSSFVDFEGTMNVLKAAQVTKVKRVIHASSWEVYGNQKLPLTEDMEACPTSFLGMQKAQSESACKLYSCALGLETVSLRYFNVYGPRRRDDPHDLPVIAKFMEQKSRGEPLSIHGDGTQTRDFTHVYDIVDANLLAASSPHLGEGEAINISTGVDSSINRVAGLIGGPYEYIGTPETEPGHVLASMKKAHEVLGWIASVRIEDGIYALRHGNKERQVFPAISFDD